MKVVKNEIFLIYNSKIIRDRETLAYAKALKSYVIKDLDITKDFLTQMQLAEIAQKLNVTMRGLLDKKSASENTNLLHLSEDDLFKVLKNNPDLLRTPIAIYPDKAAFIGSPYDFVNKDMDLFGAKSEERIQEKRK